MRGKKTKNPITAFAKNNGVLMLETKNAGNTQQQVRQHPWRVETKLIYDCEFQVSKFKVFLQMMSFD